MVFILKLANTLMVQLQLHSEESILIQDFTQPITVTLQVMD